MENYPKWKEAKIWRHPIFHWTMIVRGVCFTQNSLRLIVWSSVSSNSAPFGFSQALLLGASTVCLDNMVQRCEDGICFFCGRIPSWRKPVGLVSWCWCFFYGFENRGGCWDATETFRSNIHTDGQWTYKPSKVTTPPRNKPLFFGLILPKWFPFYDSGY